MKQTEREKLVDEFIHGTVEKCETVGELAEVLELIVFTLGGLICHFPRDTRSETLIGLTQAMAMGMQITSKNIGEPSDVEVILGGSSA